jgi:triacylglycerol esterase/lipase EstA (alpha/beta hydrolase family)
MTLTRLAGGALTALALSLPCAASAQAAHRIQPNEGAAIGAAFLDPSAPPPGVNDFSCRLTAAHPRPVVLIPGTFANMEDDYGAVGPVLANDGYCVFSLNYGGIPGVFIQATGPVPQSAKQIGVAVDKVAANYPGVKVDLIGHSQGGMLAEYVAKVLGYGPQLHTIVALSPTTHGTTLGGWATLAQQFPGANLVVGLLCQACVDQEAGSKVIQTLDNGPIAQPGVSYTILETRNETVVTPVGSAFIQEPGVDNRYVQSACASDSVDHANMSYDNTTIRLVLNALDPSTASAPDCSHTYPASAVQQ